jgi:hypothetical protein
MAGRARRAAFGLAILSAALVSSAGGADRGIPPAATPFDLIIEHGHVIDGTGAPWYAADLGIRGGRIAASGRLDQAPAKRRIDATGRVVATHKRSPTGRPSRRPISSRSACNGCW